MSDAFTSINCNLCKRNFKDVKIYEQHLKVDHRIQTNLNCGFNCGRKYNSIPGLRKHMQKCKNKIKSIICDVSFSCHQCQRKNYFLFSKFIFFQDSHNLNRDTANETELIETQAAQTSNENDQVSNRQRQLFCIFRLWKR